MFEYIINRLNKLDKTTQARPHGETKTEEPVNTVNNAIEKEKYAKDDDVKHLSKIVIPETVRADTTKSFASQLDVFATLCGLHGPVARSVILFPSQHRIASIIVALSCRKKKER